MLTLRTIKRTDPKLIANMAIHYSQPKGFVGRNICYEISYGDKVYGHIVAGSATLHLAGRNEFMANKNYTLNSVVNNIFYHVEPREGYPMRNFTVACLSLFRKTVSVDWETKYGDVVLAFESLVQLPRTGEVYRRDGWTLVGQTIGYTCKRVAGNGTDSWSGKRIWNTKELKPKHVFMKLA